MGAGRLEVFKFGIYLCIPIATVYYFNSPELVRAVIEQQQYVVVPPEGKRPPASREELAAYEAQRDRAVGAFPVAASAAAASAAAAPAAAASTSSSWFSWR